MEIPDIEQLKTILVVFVFNYAGPKTIVFSQGFHKQTEFDDCEILITFGNLKTLKH